VDDDRLIELYSGALASVYAPYDEDYGYVTLESFLSRKPVITARDSGGTLEFVEDGANGFVCEPAAASIGAAINRLARDRGLAARLGDAGFARASQVSWNGVIEKLVGSRPPSLGGPFSPPSYGEPRRSVRGERGAREGGDSGFGIRDSTKPQRRART
jgi:hypothetical protein